MCHAAAVLPKLPDHAREDGDTAVTREADVIVIDDDLGRSASGIGRPGFERLLAAICEGRAGAVFALVCV